MLILIAGPYRSNTDDNPELIAENMHRMEEAALTVYRKGHTPVCGEWTVRRSGCIAAHSGGWLNSSGRCCFQRNFPPDSVRLIDHCDAVLRVGGPSAGAYEMMKQAELKGKKTYWELEELTN